MSFCTAVDLNLRLDGGRVFDDDEDEEDSVGVNVDVDGNAEAAARSDGD